MASFGEKRGDATTLTRARVRAKVISLRARPRRRPYPGDRVALLQLGAPSTLPRAGRPGPTAGPPGHRGNRLGSLLRGPPRPGDRGPPQGGARPALERP